jgi:glycosyltransferase involved in cell wall biosynthesis
VRVLMLSKACIVGAYQKKLEELARFEDVELTVAVPPYWREKGHRIPLERAHTTGYRLIVEEMAFNGHFHLHFYPHLGRLIRRLRPHILHIDEEPYNLATFQALWLGKRAGARCLFFTWQNIPKRYPPPFSWIESYVLRHADCAIAGNTEALNVLKTKGYRGPTRVIPQFGVDPEMYREMRERRGEPLVIGYVGRLVEEKGPQLLLQAMAGLGGEWRLRLLGAGPLRAKLERLAGDLGLAGRVAFDPPIPSAEMPGYLNRLDVLVLPSLTRPHWKEQFGRVLIEAMACGVDVVGSTCGEIPHVIGDAGLLFPEGDVEALRARLAQLMGDPDLRRDLARRGRERVLARYTQAQVAAETYEVYRALAELA